MILPDEITTRFSPRRQLHDGRLTTYFDPIDGQVEVGQRFTFHIGLQDAANADAGGRRSHNPYSG